MGVGCVENPLGKHDNYPHISSGQAVMLHQALDLLFHLNHFEIIKNGVVHLSEQIRSTKSYI